MFKRLTKWRLKKSTRLLVLPIKGCFYYGADMAESIDKLYKGAHLSLTPEPDNQYDANAIQIKLNEPITLIGYIPRNQTDKVHYLRKHHRIEAVFLETAYRQYKRLYLYVGIRYQSNWFDFFRRTFKF